MDIVLKVILMIIAAWLAYVVVRGERATRMWTPATSVAALLTIFGAIAYGLLRVETFFTWKLIGNSSSSLRGVESSLAAGAQTGQMFTNASGGDLLVAGIVVIAVLVVLALDLLGKVDVMGKLSEAIAGAAQRPSAGGD